MRQKKGEAAVIRFPLVVAPGWLHFPELALDGPLVVGSLATRRGRWGLLTARRRLLTGRRLLPVDRRAHLLHRLVEVVSRPANGADVRAL